MNRKQVLDKLEAEWDAAAAKQDMTAYDTAVWCSVCDGGRFYNGRAKAGHRKWHLEQAQAFPMRFWHETHHLHGHVVVPFSMTTQTGHLAMTRLAGHFIEKNHANRHAPGWAPLIPAVSFVLQNTKEIRQAGFFLRCYRETHDAYGFVLMNKDDFKFIYDLFAALTTYDEARAVFADMKNRRSAMREAA